MDCPLKGHGPLALRAPMQYFSLLKDTRDWGKNCSTSGTEAEELRSMMSTWYIRGAHVVPTQGPHSCLCSPFPTGICLLPQGAAARSHTVHGNQRLCWLMYIIALRKPSPFPFGCTRAHKEDVKDLAGSPPFLSPSLKTQPSCWHLVILYSYEGNSNRLVQTL